MAQIGDFVRFSANKAIKVGTVRWIGDIKGTAGVWAGIELLEANGNNNGSHGGISYFSCKEKYGVFVKVGGLRVLSDEDAEKERKLHAPAAPKAKPSLKVPTKLPKTSRLQTPTSSLPSPSTPSPVKKTSSKTSMVASPTTKTTRVSPRPPSASSTTRPPSASSTTRPPSASSTTRKSTSSIKTPTTTTTTKTPIKSRLSGIGVHKKTTSKIGVGIKTKKAYIEKPEPVEETKVVEKPEPVEVVEKPEPVEVVEKPEPVEETKVVEKPEPVEVVEKPEPVEETKVVEKPEPVEVVEKPLSVEKAKVVEETKIIEPKKESSFLNEMKKKPVKEEEPISQKKRLELESFEKKKIEVSSQSKAKQIPSDYTKKLDDMKSQISKLKTQLNDKSAEVRDIEIENEELHLVINKLNVEKEKTETKLSSMQLDLDNALDEIDNLHADIGELRASNSVSKEDYLDSLPTDQQEVAEIVEQNQKLIEALTKLKDLVISNETAFAQKEEMYLDQLDNIPDLQDQIQELEQMRPLLAACKLTIEDLKEQVDSARDFESIVESLTEKNLTLGEDLSDMTEQYDKMRELAFINESEIKTHKTLEKELTQELEKAQVQVLETQREFASQQRLCEDLEAQVNKYRMAVALLSEEVNAARSREDELADLTDEQQEKQQAVLSRHMSLLSKIQSHKQNRVSLNLAMLESEQSQKKLKMLEAYIPQNLNVDFNSIGLQLVLHKLQFKLDLLLSLINDYYQVSDASDAENVDLVLSSHASCHLLYSILRQVSRLNQALTFCNDSQTLNYAAARHRDLLPIDKILDVLLNCVTDNSINFTTASSDLSSSLDIINSFIENHFTPSQFSTTEKDIFNPIGSILLNIDANELSLSDSSNRIRLQLLRRLFSPPNSQDIPQEKLEDSKLSEEFLDQIRVNIVQKWETHLSGFGNTCTRFLSLTEKARKIQTDEKSIENRTILLYSDFRSLSIEASKLRDALDNKAIGTIKIIEATLSPLSLQEDSSIFSIEIQNELQTHLSKELSDAEDSLVIAIKSATDSIECLISKLSDAISLLCPDAKFFPANAKPSTPLWTIYAETVRDDIQAAADTKVQLHKALTDTQEKSKQLFQSEQFYREKNTMLSLAQEKNRILQARLDEQSDFKKQIDDAKNREKNLDDTIKKLKKDVIKHENNSASLRADLLATQNRIRILERKGGAGGASAAGVVALRSIIRSLTARLSTSKSHIEELQLRTLEITDPLPSILELSEVVTSHDLIVKSKSRTDDLKSISSLSENISNLSNRLLQLQASPSVVKLDASQSPEEQWLSRQSQAHAIKLELSKLKLQLSKLLAKQERRLLRAAFTPTRALAQSAHDSSILASQNQPDAMKICKLNMPKGKADLVGRISLPSTLVSRIPVPVILRDLNQFIQVHDAVARK